jgi:CheY-like chemotaxis protein
VRALSPELQCGARGVGSARAEPRPHRRSTADVLADDHGVLRGALRRLLDDENGFEVVGEAADTLTTLQMVRAHRPDVVVLDLNMPGGSSIAAIPTIKRVVPHTRVVVLTMERDPSLVRAAYDAGALLREISRASSARRRRRSMTIKPLGRGCGHRTPAGAVAGAEGG